MHSKVSFLLDIQPQCVTISLFKILNLFFNILINGGTGLNIGKQLKDLRLTMGLTQEELAQRSELTKGFISMVERDLTSPSIATLSDLLEALGSSLPEFFQEDEQEQIVFGEADYYVSEQEESGCQITWVVPNAQKNAMEPVLLSLEPGGESLRQAPGEAEYFGYVLKGHVKLILNEQSYVIKAGESFYYQPKGEHRLVNSGKKEAKLIWVCTPPTF